MSHSFDLARIKIGVVGLGYVGLPLAVALGKQYPTIGFDTSPGRIAELREGKDSSLEVEPEELIATPKLSYTEDPNGMADCNLFIVTVPTPVNENNQPDLRPLESASRTIGALLKAGDIVVYESTVYGLSRRHRGGLRAHTGAGIGPVLQSGSLCRLQPRTDQPR